MIATRRFELPEELERKRQKAVKLEWWTVGYLVSVVLVMYFVLGSSQAMKAAWLEDILSIVPAVSFLIANSVFTKQPNKHFPYGYHRVFGIAFLTGAVALTGMGAFLVFDSSMALFRAEHPTIGTVRLFGATVWLGWPMILALLYSAVPAMVIGRIKQQPAKDLHNKILYTDADAQKADYMTAGAAILGILGIGLGLWWADAVAALAISASVLRDGITRTRDGVTDLMDRHPKKVEGGQYDELVEQLADRMRTLDWVEDARVRLRENGQVYFGEIFVLPRTTDNLVDKIEHAVDFARDLHWKIHDVVVMPVASLPEEADDTSDNSRQS